MLDLAKKNRASVAFALGLLINLDHVGIHSSQRYIHKNTVVQTQDLSLWHCTKNEVFPLRIC